MAGSYPTQADLGSYVPTSFVITSLADASSALNSIAIVLNTKESGIYPLTEFANGSVWFPDPLLTSASPQAPTLRAEYTKVFNLGALAAVAGTTTIAHELVITSGYKTTHIYGSATNPSTMFIPLPYSSATAADVVEIWLDATNINIKIGKDLSAYTNTTLVVKYLKD